MCWKSLKPKSKQQDLSKDLLSSYRPISNIAFLGKIIEKIVASQVHAYLQANNLFPSLQSAYRQHHSTETALVKVTNDILRSLGDHQDVMLVLLDHTMASNGSSLTSQNAHSRLL